MRNTLLMAVLMGVLPQMGVLPLGQAGAEEAPAHETVLDRKVHLEPAAVRDLPRVPPLCEAFSGQKGYAEIGDCRLYYEVEGEGMPIVLLNGGPGCTHHYFHPDLSRAAAFARVIYYDQRGCGKSDHKPGAGYTLDQAVEDLEKLRRKLGIERWVVLGHSYGGFLAQYYAVTHPEALAGLILVGASPAMPLPLERTRQYDYLSPEERARIGASFGDGSLSPEARLFNAHLNGDWKRQSFYRPARDELVRMVLYEWKHDNAFRSGVLASMEGIDLAGAFDACPIPTLVAEGRWDLTWNTDKPAKLQAALPRSELVLFERSGHSPFADEPERFCQVLREFLRKPPATPEAAAKWKAELAAWKAQQERQPSHILRNSGWGRKSNLAVAGRFAEEWLQAVDDPGLLLKLGFALYDAGRYDRALAAFEAMQRRADRNPFDQAIALIWQGHMLDLLGRREDAVTAYRAAAALNIQGGIRHDQFGLQYSPASYAAERMKTPFTRVENTLDD